MKTYTSLNKPDLQKIRVELNKVLAKYGADVNLEFTLGNINFTSGDFRVKLEGKVKGAETRDDKVLDRMISQHNLSRNSRCGATLVGYNSRAHRYPFLYKESSGKTYKAALSSVRIKFMK